MKKLNDLGREHGWVSVIPLIIIVLAIVFIVNAWVVMLAFNLIASGWPAIPALSFKASIGVVLLAAVLKTSATIGD